MSESNETPTNPVKAAIAQTISSHKKKIVFALGPDMEDAMQKAGYEPTNAASPLQYALGQASGSANKKAPQLSFTTNPAPSDNYLGLYKAKRRLLQDELLKQIRITDNLVASILRTRGNMMSLFGQIRKNRFDIGLEVKIKPEFEKILTPEQYEKVMERMKKFEQLLLNCGHTEGLEQQDRTTLSSTCLRKPRTGSLLVGSAPK